MNYLLALTITVCASVLAQTSDQEALVRFRILTESGGDVSSGTLTVSNQNGDVQERRTLPGRITEVRLAPGKYRVRFSANGWDDAYRTIEVPFSRSSFYLISVRMAQFNDLTPFGGLSIRVVSMSSCKSEETLWARIFGVFSAYSGEVELSQRGFGLFEGLPIGRYVLVIGEGGMVRKTLSVSVDRSPTVISVALDGCVSER